MENMGEKLESVEILVRIKNKSPSMYNEFIRVYKKVEPLLNNRINSVFSTYTLHDVNHSIRIMNYMGKLVPNLEKLNEFELLLLAYSALLHDVGMAASSEEIEKIRNNKLVFDGISYVSILEKFSGDDALAIQDYIRMAHAERSAEYIKKNLIEDLVIPNMPGTSFTDQVALICQAHTKDISWIKENLESHGIKGDYSFNTQFCAIILRLADILDFDSQRTPRTLFESIAPQGFGEKEWKQHFSIENTSKIRTVNGNNVVELYGKCSNPVIHRKILGYIEWINSEITHANDISQNFSEEYRIFLFPKVSNFIKAEGYSIADMKFKVNFSEITKLLMGESLYGNKHFGLRELIQNSIDTCNLKKEIEEKKRKFGEEEYIARIKVIFDENRNEVIIKDNGMGMDLHILKNYFLKLGVSFYNSDDYKLKGYEYQPIGNYGIGFLACFMLSENVLVRTKHINSSTIHEVELNKLDEYVSINHKANQLFQGTEVILQYDKFMKSWESYDQVFEFLEDNFLTSTVKLEFVIRDKKVQREVNNFLYDSEEKGNIDLSKFLIGIEGGVKITQDLDNIFEDSLESISFSGTPIILKDENLIEVDESTDDLKVSDFIEGQIMVVQEFPIIEDVKDLERSLEVIDDVGEAFEKYEDKYHPTYINLVTTPGDSLYVRRGFINHDDEILADISMKDFEAYGQDIESGTMINIKKKTLFNIGNNELYIELKLENNYQNIIINDKQKLFIRDVFVKKLNFNIPNRIEKLNINEAKINVVNRALIPDVTRNNLKSSDDSMLTNSIYMAVCFYIWESVDDVVKKETILGYLRTYFNQKPNFIKEEYNILLNSVIAAKTATEIETEIQF